MEIVLPISLLTLPDTLRIDMIFGSFNFLRDKGSLFIWGECSGRFDIPEKNEG